MTTDQLTLGAELATVDAYRFRRTQPVQLLVKHTLDRLIAALLLLLLLPLLVVVALAVRLTSPGPVFYRQERPGQHGRMFSLWKFRTMVDGADARLGEVLRRHGKARQPLFKAPDDPRVTPLGRFLRKYSIDELPQLVNVVRGEMSLVGPRPHQSWEVAQYGPRELVRLRVRPGLTGLWQVSGRSSLPWQIAIDLDLQYIEQWSLRSDLLILMRTPLAVLRGEGAY
jgi:exopolysaccharide biosynthesis polyprenyl glycosylphosphotransferase